MATNSNNYLALGLKVLALALYLVVVVATCAGVWNGNKEPFAIVCSIILLVLTLVGAVCLFRQMRARAIPAGQKKKEVNNDKS